VPVPACPTGNSALERELFFLLSPTAEKLFRDGAARSPHGEKQSHRIQEVVI
jgi:hypothetical protein